jgi:hypothetical protein
MWWGLCSLAKRKMKEDTELHGEPKPTRLAAREQRLLQKNGEISAVDSGIFDELYISR